MLSQEQSSTSLHSGEGDSRPMVHIGSDLQRVNTESQQEAVQRKPGLRMINGIVLFVIDIINNC